MEILENTTCANCKGQCIVFEILIQAHTELFLGKTTLRVMPVWVSPAQWIGCVVINQRLKKEQGALI